MLIFNSLDDIERWASDQLARYLGDDFDFQCNQLALFIRYQKWFQYGVDLDADIDALYQGMGTWPDFGEDPEENGE